SEARDVGRVAMWILHPLELGFGGGLGERRLGVDVSGASDLPRHVSTPTKAGGGARDRRNLHGRNRAPPRSRQAPAAGCADAPRARSRSARAAGVADTPPRSRSACGGL